MNDSIAKERVSLSKKLYKDLELLGLTPRKLNYDLEFKNYSKRYYGRYIRKKVDGEVVARILVYIFRNKYCVTFYDYKDIISTTIHEICHHLQYEDENWHRKRGVMHDKEFWDLYNHYMNKYFELTNSTGGERYEESVRKSIRKGSNPNT